MNKSSGRMAQTEFINGHRTEDRTGRDRMVSNVFWGWVSNFFVIVIGFIMPRMIDRYIGQFSLGIWDFGWSIVSYMSLSNLGIGASVNRYVAKLRANNDTESLRKAVSSVAFVQLFIGCFIFMMTLVIVILLPHYFMDKLGEEISNAQWVIAALGTSLAIEQVLHSYRGVMTGSHRWDLHNKIDLFSRFVAFVSMFSVLLLGMGLRALGMVYLFTIILTETIRVIAAYRVCPELKIGFRYIDRPQLKEMFIFGWKTIIATISPLVLVQTANILVVSTLGPALLAVLSRSITLVRHMETFINKFAHITTPTAGAMQAGNKVTELRQFLLDSTRYTVAILLPITFIFIILGDIILTLWMGSGYAQHWVLAILATGYFLPISQSPVLRILVGLNLHGRIGAVSLAVTLTLFAILAIIINSIGWDLVTTALLIGIPLTVGNGIIIPVFTCHRLKISLKEYLRYSFGMPFLCSLPFGIILYISRMDFPVNQLLMAGLGLFLGSIISSIFCWRFLLTENVRSRFIKLIKARRPFQKKRADHDLARK